MIGAFTRAAISAWMPWAVVAILAIPMTFQTMRENQHAAAINQEASRPVTDWMFVSDLHVPDFKVGEDPLVVFTRTVSEDRFGGWGVEVHSRRGEQMCSVTIGKRGGAVYRASENPSVSIRFQKYTGGCDLPPGEYRVTVLIMLASKIGGPAKPITFQSNWFAVNR